MKNESTYAKKFSAFLKRLKTPRVEEAPAQTPIDPVTQIVIAFLEWNATSKAAKDAHARISAVMVDNNDLRVSHPHEIVALIGERYPQAEERAMRLHEALQEVFVREHGVSLESLADKPRKQVWTYLSTLPGTPLYVAAKTMLVSYGGHTIPIDDRMADLLKDADVVADDSTVDVITSFMERHIKADEAAHAHLALRTWADGQTSRPSKPAGKAAKKSPKKSSKKS